MSPGPVDDEAWMAEAVTAGAGVRTTTSPNPWVGAVVVPDGGGAVHHGATRPPGGAHAEVVALTAAGPEARGATVYVTLEPCAHHGRTPPCTDALVAAGVARVVVALEDPDPHVSGAGIAALRAAGIRVDVGPGSVPAGASLAPYLVHRRTGRPYVVLKLAATLDGRIAAPDGTSRWITSAEARVDAHRLRAESDAIAVGAGTVRADDPQLTVRDAGGREVPGASPRRVVLGRARPGARVHPALQHTGPLFPLLDRLGAEGVLQLLVEGGASVAHRFHAEGLVDRYVVYLAPALLGGDDGVSMFAGPGAATMADVWRGRVVALARLGPDIRIDVVAGDGLGD
jgi:diaminohydroxyphosphoribosylaminopyrimidine deaminase/5-amino-6-(5-phosphoribosylamino)uracil reductase